MGYLHSLLAALFVSPRRADTHYRQLSDMFGYLVSGCCFGAFWIWRSVLVFFGSLWAADGLAPQGPFGAAGCQEGQEIRKCLPRAQ